MEAHLFRIPIDPSPSNGLRHSSQVMIDKMTALPTNRISKRAGTLAPKDMTKIKSALRLWLELDD
jgi:mRNA interferase MazF